MVEGTCDWDTSYLNKKNFLVIHVWVLMICVISMFIGINYIYSVGVMYRKHRNMYKLVFKIFLFF